MVLILGGVWGAVIDLDDFFAGFGAGVFDFDGRLNGVAIDFEGEEFLLEAGVA